MHNRANTNTDKAAAARAQRKLVRGRSRRRVMFSTIALFALVFTLLSFRLTAGMDPSSSGNTVATTSTPSTQSATSDEELEQAEDEQEEAAEAAEEASESADDDSGFSGTSSADSTTSTQAPAAPTTRAS